MKSNMKKIPLSSSSAPMKRNFKISDDDESCVGDMLDPCGQCVTKGQLRDGTLVNRLLMCCFSVVLLWASSFSTAVYITNSVVSSPQFASVRDSCDATYQQAQRQKQDYITCVDRQVNLCCSALFVINQLRDKLTFVSIKCGRLCLWTRVGSA